MFEAFTQHFDARCFDEDGKRTVSIKSFDVASAQDIHIEDDVASFSQLTIDLAAQSSVELILVHLLVFEEFTLLDA